MIEAVLFILLGWLLATAARWLREPFDPQPHHVQSLVRQALRDLPEEDRAGSFVARLNGLGFKIVRK